MFTDSPLWMHIRRVYTAYTRREFVDDHGRKVRVHMAV